MIAPPSPAVVLHVWSWDQQHHLGTRWKCRFSGPTSDLSHLKL